MHLQAISIQDLPYDVIHTIFSCCLPESPLAEVQPNTTIAPLLLCHVCSSWRTAVLASPALWSYIHCRLPIMWCNRLEQLIAWNAKVFQRGIEFLIWWRRNHGSKAPFIRVESYSEQGEENLGQELPLTANHKKFFVEYLSSAQYLDVDGFVPYLFSQNPSESSSMVSFPKLHSFATNYLHNDEDNARKATKFNTFHPPALQHLRIHNVEMVNLDNTFTSWSGLTHLALHNNYIPQWIWYSLIRGLPNLQWGYFNNDLSSTNDREPPKPFTLPFLSTLCVRISNIENAEDEPLRQLFGNLHFPVLYDLSIYIDADPYGIRFAAMKINTGLELAPALKKLTLGIHIYDFFTFQHDEQMSMSPWETMKRLPNVARTPHLTHLVLDMCYGALWDYENMLPERLAHWKKVLQSSRCQWLDLTNPASAMHKISAMVKDPAGERPLVEAAIRGALKLDVEEDCRETHNIVFEIIPESPKPWESWGCLLEG